MDTKTQALELVSLKGKVAIITGGASGIGFETARHLAEMGASVALLDVDESKGEEAVKKMKDLGGNVIFYKCDVTSNSDCKKTTEDIVKDFSRIDILVNNAGVIRRKNIVELEEEEWDLVLNVNLKAIFLLSHYVIPHMVEKGRGSIINIGSGWGLKGGPRAAAYCAAKGGTVNLTRAMAIDHGRQGIRVNCVCPGDTDTQLLHDEAAQLGEDEGEFIKAAAERPLNRVGLPQDIANAVLFFASEMSSWVTGSVLVVDGGGLV